LGLSLSRLYLPPREPKIVVIEKQETAEEIVGDLDEVIVSMCARLYGKRPAANGAKKAREALDG
jgi:putative resolvase